MALVIFISKWKLQISSPLQNLFWFLDSQSYALSWRLLLTGNGSSSTRPKTSVKNSKVSGIAMLDIFFPSLFRFFFLSLKTYVGSWIRTMASATHDMNSAARSLSHIPWYTSELHWLLLFEVPHPQVHIRTLPPVTDELSDLGTEQQLTGLSWLLVKSNVLLCQSLH